MILKYNFKKGDPATKVFDRSQSNVKMKKKLSKFIMRKFAKLGSIFSHGSRIAYNILLIIGEFALFMIHSQLRQKVLLACFTAAKMFLRRTSLVDTDKIKNNFRSIFSMCSFGFFDS